MRVAIVGGRDFPNAYVAVFTWLENHAHPDWVIVSGGARGVDAAAKLYAGTNGHGYVEYPADWKTYGRSAGYRRNRDIVANSDAVVAFWDGKSRGTKHSIDIAREMGKPLIIVAA